MLRGTGSVAIDQAVWARDVSSSAWSQRRVYFVRKGAALVILLCGGDKSTQSRDIKQAKALADNLEDEP